MQRATLLSIAALCVATALGGEHEASAQRRPPALKSAEAKRHLDRGLRYFDLQDYERAVDEFRAGYAIEAGADFLYALGQAERLRGNCPAAVEAYRAFLERHPPSSEEKLARDNLDKCAATAAPEPAEAAEPRSPPAIAPPPPLAAPNAKEKKAPATASPFYTDVLGDVLGGAGVVALGAGMTLVLVGNGHASASQRAATYDDAVREIDAADDTRRAAIVFGVVGAALVVASVVRWATR